jgi:hypothetical protein
MGDDMKVMIGALALLAVFTVPHAALGQGAQCVQLEEPGGMGLTVTKKCAAETASGFSEDDAYYLVEMKLTPEEGFGNGKTFDKKSAGGKALQGFLKAFFNSEKSTNLDIGLTVIQGATVYPVMSMMNFQLVDDNRWRSSVRADYRTMLHKLGAGEQFYVEINYSYSKTKRIDLTKATDVVGSLGVKLVTPAVSPFINVARDVVNETMKASGVDMQSGYKLALFPWKGETSEVEFRLTSPTGVPFARVNVQVRGTRSLMANARRLKEMADSLPTDNVTSPLVNLPKEMITGQARDWPLLNAALGPVPSLSEVLGKQLTTATLPGFCNSVSTGLSTSYLLTSFDSVLVQARLVEAATDSIRPQVNPYKRCFQDGKKRALIASYLGIDTEYQEPDPTDPKPAPYEALFMLGCVLKGATGDECGPPDASRRIVLASLSPSVRIGALDTLPPQFSLGLPETSYMVTQADFLSRFAGKFARFRNISINTQTMTISERADSADLSLKVTTDKAGKIVAVEIRAAGVQA